MEETQSLLYKFKPISDRLPAVTRPEGHVHFRTKMMWVVVILLIYFVMTNVYIYGLDHDKTLDLFAQYRTIMAGASGSLLQLGIGPIVTASIIMQLFVGAKIIKLDLTKKEDKECYQSILKLLVIVMILFEAIPQVFGYLVPSDKFVSTVGGMSSARLLIILQLFVGSYIVFLMDEVVSKWGIGSGISLFIAAGVSQALFTGTLNWNPVTADAPLSFSNVPAGTIPKVIYVLMNANAAQMANGGYDIMLLQQPNPLIALVGTILIFFVVAYMESTRIELPLSHGSARGARGRYPIKLVYASNIPVILMSALLANISMFGLLFYSNPALSGIPFLGGNDMLGYYPAGSTQAASGLAWYLSAPSGLTSWLLPILDPTADALHGPIQNLMRVIIYFTIMVLGSVLFAKFWVSTTNMGPEAVAKQIQKSGMQIPGFRRDPRVLKRVLERYIPTVTILSGAIVGALAAGADLIGTTGHASGTGVLLTVGILIQFYEAMGREQMMEMHPVMRGFFDSD